MRHLGKDTEQRAGLQLVPSFSRHSVQLFKNHLDLTVIEVDKFGDNKERKQRWKFRTKSWGTIIFRNPTVEPSESLGKSERWKTNQERLAHESDQVVKEKVCPTYLPSPFLHVQRIHKGDLSWSLNLSLMTHFLSLF